jgi:peptidoglycan/xylan/chitin deacetylase (PgdA/CDA1 family)
MRKRHLARHVFQKDILLGALTAIVFLVIGATTTLLIIYFSRSHISEVKPVLETRKNEAKDLPKEFKKKLQIASSSATYRVPILMYHYVENVQDKNDKMRMELNIPPYIFEQQLKTLLGAGYTFMTASELGQVFDGKMEMPNKPILITFDDGHWDVATVILPILEKYHIKATAYVIPGFIGGSDFMTSQELQEVIKSGLVDVGAHTVHHLSLRGRPYATVQYEVDQSKKMLEQTYHIKVVSFAYPYGRFDQQAVQIVKDDGFTTAVSTAPGVEQSQVNRYFLYRIHPEDRTGATLLSWLSQDHFSAY